MGFSPSSIHADLLRTLHPAIRLLISSLSCCLSAWILFCWGCGMLLSSVCFWVSCSSWHWWFQFFLTAWVITSFLYLPFPASHHLCMSGKSDFFADQNVWKVGILFRRLCPLVVLNLVSRLLCPSGWCCQGGLLFRLLSGQNVGKLVRMKWHCCVVSV